MNKAILLIASLALMLVSTSAFTGSGREASLGKIAPVAIVTQQNDSVATPADAISANRGSWIVLSFWRSSDAQSRSFQNELESFTGVLSHESGLPSVKAVNINLDSSSELAAEIIRRDGLDVSKQYAAHNARSLQEAYKVTKDCRSFLIDPQGKVVKTDLTISDVRRIIQI